MAPLLTKALQNTDERVRESKPVTPAFLFAAILWQPVRERSAELAGQGETEFNAMMQASEEVIYAQVGSTAIPRRFSAVTRQIWTTQPRFAKIRGKRWRRILHEPRFRAAYDFLLLRAFEDPSLNELCEFWTKAQEGMDFTPPARSRSERPRRRYRRSNSNRAGSSR